MAKAVEVRYAAYKRHTAAFAEALAIAEPLDLSPASALLLAESKLDATALGSVRIQTNTLEPLWLEQSVELPNWLRTRHLAEPTRLGVVHSALGSLVKSALLKACFQFCTRTGVEWMVIGARAPLDRKYDELLFDDVFPGRGYVPLRHAGDLPHRILMLEIESARRRWAAARHPMFEFMFESEHEEIDLDADM